MIKELIQKTRSYRRFDETVNIDRQTLCELVDLARCSASSGNTQPLKYLVYCDPATNARIFKHLGWAGALRDWSGPAEGERPTGYIIILGDQQISTSPGVDHGIACQSIMLGAAEKGLGGCIIGSIDRQHLRSDLNVADRYDVLLVLALGKPAEKVVLEDADPGGSVTYYRDADDVHHVPKRRLEELILN